MEVDGLDETERAGKGFGITGTGLELKETQPTICFLQANGNHEYYDSSDINQHPIVRKGQVLLSNTSIDKADLKGFDADLLAKVRQMAEEDLGWMQLKKELESLKEEGKELPKQWSILEFVTGRGGAGFHSPGSALTTGRGGYFGGGRRPTTVRDESPRIPCMGPRFSPPVLRGTCLGNGQGRGQGQGTIK